MVQVLAGADLIAGLNLDCIMAKQQSRETGAKGAARVVGLVIALATLGVVGGVGYVHVIHPTLVPKNFGIVEPGKVYRSGELTPAATRRVVEERKIKTIVDLGAYDKDPALERVAERTAAALGVERRVFRLEGDGTGNPNAYVEALRIITDPSKQPVLVHCSAGAQRTSGCILLYREIVQGTPIEQNMHEAYAHRHDPSDNPRLTPFLNQWRGPIAEAFKRGGLIEGQPPAEIVSPAREDATTPKP